MADQAQIPFLVAYLPFTLTSSSSLLLFPSFFLFARLTSRFFSARSAYNTHLNLRRALNSKSGKIERLSGKSESISYSLKLFIL